VTGRAFQAEAQDLPGLQPSCLSSIHVRLLQAGEADAADGQVRPVGQLAVWLTCTAAARAASPSRTSPCHGGSRSSRTGSRPTSTARPPSWDWSPRISTPTPSSAARRPSALRQQHAPAPGAGRGQQDPQRRGRSGGPPPGQHLRAAAAHGTDAPRAV